MAHSLKSPASQEAGAQPPSSAGYLLLPRQLRQDCRHVGINTLKLVLFVADATLGWDFSRWAALTYRVLVAEAGIPNDTCVRRATLEALASSLIEVQTTAAGTLYAIHRRYWVSARVQPKWHLYKRVPYDQEADPLDESQPAITMIAEQHELAERASQPAITTIAQPLETDAPATDGAITMIASDYHQDSGSLSPGKQAAIKVIAQPLAEDTSGLTPHDAKEGKKEERKERGKEETITLSELPVAQDVERLSQRQADQHILQQLLAEQERLRQAKPSMSGWGEAQRRLRSLAREIPRLQARVISQATAPGSNIPATVSGQAEPAEERKSPQSTPPIRRIRDQAASAETSPAPDPRRQRLMQLQRELAQLKRTPSMQLLARQRIPKLEAEIKQLISELQESA